MADNYNIFIGDKMEEECGVFGVYDPKNTHDISSISYLGLLALQHRGQESAGICVNKSGKFTNHKGMGLVENVFTKDKLAKIDGEMAVSYTHLTLPTTPYV